MVELALEVQTCMNDSIQGLALLTLPKATKAKALVARLVRTEEVKGQLLQHVEVASQVVMRWSDERLQPGKFNYSFTLVVPRGLPGDAEVERRNLKVSITHWLTIAFLGRKSREVSRKLCISPEFLSEATVVKSKRSLTTSGCFCLRASTTQLIAQVPTAVTPHDSIKVLFDIDSRSSRQSLRDLSVALIQRVSLSKGRVFDDKIVAKALGTLGKGHKHQVEVDLSLVKHKGTLECALTCLGRYVKVEYLIRLEGRRGKAMFEYDLGSVFIVDFLRYDCLPPKSSPAPNPNEAKRTTKPILKKSKSLAKRQSILKRPGSPGVKDEVDQAEEVGSSENERPSVEAEELSGMDSFYEEVVQGLEADGAKMIRPSRICFDAEDPASAPKQRAMSITDFCKIIEQVEDQLRSPDAVHGASHTNTRPEDFRSRGELA